MHLAVEQAFVTFNSPLEGICKNLYLDVKNLATTAIGCLVDPLSLALPLPWVMPDGTRASQAEIARQWQSLKAQPGMSHYPALSKTVLGATTMRLTDDGILQIVSQRLLANEKILRSYFPGWDLIPADGMLGILSMSWALGASFPHTFGNFRAAVNAQNWTAAIASCDIRTDGNPGIIPRNKQNKLCFANAASVLAQGIPLTDLFWPGTAPNASQRDQALHTEASLAVAAYTSNILQHGGEFSAEGDAKSPTNSPGETSGNVA